MALRIDLYSAAGAKLDVPPLEGNAISAFSHGAAEKKVGSFSLSVPLGEAAEVQAGRRIYVYESTEGLIFKGQIDVIETTIQGGERMVVATGWSLARIKMVKKTTLNRRFDNASLSTILSALLSGTDYSAGSVDTPSTNLTIPLFGNTIWDALGKVANGFGYLLREDFINDTIDMGAFGDASGVVLGNVESHSPALSANPYFGVISGLKQKARTQEVYNKLIPLGQQQGIASTANAPYLTLENSTRSSPYTIQTGTNPDGTTYWYISDSTSVATYGECERYIPFSFVAPLGTATADLQRSANTLYDLAVTALQKEKDEQVAYEVDVTNLRHRTGGAYTFELGQTMRLKYHGTIVTDTGTEVLLDIDRDLYVMEYTRAFDSAGASAWRLVVSTISRITPSANDVLTEFVSKLTGQQVVPVPFVIFGDNVAWFSPDGLAFRSDDAGSALGAPPDGTRVRWLKDTLQGDEIGDVVGTYLTPSIFEFYQMYFRAFLGADGGNAMVGVWDTDLEDWVSAMFCNYVSNVPSWAVGTTAETWLQLSQTDATNYRLKILRGGNLVDVGGNLKSTNDGPYYLPAGNTRGQYFANDYSNFRPISELVTGVTGPTTTLSNAGGNTSMPASGIVAGDGLIAFVADDSSSAGPTPSGWAKTKEVLSLGGGWPIRGTIYTKTADGTENGTTVAFSANASQVFRVPAALWVQGSFTVSSGANGTGSVSNPDSVSFNGRSITFAFAAYRNATVVSGGSYANDNHNITTALSGGGGVECGCATSWESFDVVSSEDPIGFTGSVTSWVAMTLALRCADNDVAADTTIVGIVASPAASPDYLIVELATGDPGSEVSIGETKVLPGDSAFIPIDIDSGIRLSARVGGGAAYLSVQLLDQADQG